MICVTTVIDSMQDFTNIIAIASQPPAGFFSPKELHIPLMECLQKVNFCGQLFHPGILRDES